MELRVKSTSRLKPHIYKKRLNNEKTMPALPIASWNVRTMIRGFTNDLLQVDNVRKTAVIDQELAKLNVDIACLQETRLPGSGSVRESSYTFFWQGCPRDKPKQHGVGFAATNSLTAAIIPPSEGTERILSIGLSTSSGLVRLFSVYAPTLTSTPEEKDSFYGALDEAILKVPRTEGPYLLGDFNARVGLAILSWSTWNRKDK